MKKTLLFVILAFSMNVFAQISRPATYQQLPTLDELGKIRVTMEDRVLKKTFDYSLGRSAQSRNYQIPEGNTLTQLSESVAGTHIRSGDFVNSYSHTVVTGLRDMENSTISVYPNPTNGKFTINSNSTISSVEIYNLPGSRIYSDNMPEKQTSCEIDLSGQTKGIYLVKIMNGTKNSKRKIVLQ